MVKPLHGIIVRIIGGDLRGRLIEPPAAMKARPTTDFARESLFNILVNRYDFEEISVADLFSGTGAVSYEFASRGVKDIDLVEIDHRQCSFIRKTLEQMNISTVRVHRLDVRQWTGICSKRYDIVFADPPYNLPWLAELPRLILSSEMMSEGSLFILEHPKSMNFKNYPGFSEHRNYGNVNFSFFLK